MATNWTKRGFIIVTSAILTAANNEAKTIQAYLENAEDQALTFSVPLSPTGNDPQTHSSTNTALTEAMATAWSDFYQGGLPSARIWIMDAFTDELLDTNTNDTLGQVFTWQDALDSANLQVIEAEII